MEHTSKARFVPCPACSGYGKAPETPCSPCRACQGLGELVHPNVEITRDGRPFSSGTITIHQRGIGRTIESESFHFGPRERDGLQPAGIHD